MGIEVIAEIGVNHNGNIATAIKLIDAAREAGCDTVKFQLWNTERVYPRERWDEMKALELTYSEIADIKQYCDTRDVEFLCTPDEIEDAIFLKEIGVKRIKTSSQDVTNLPFLSQVAELGLPMIVSTGACDRIEMERAICCVRIDEYFQPVTILHCVSAYPAPIEEMNLNVINYIRYTWGPNVGLSDHSIGNLAALVALGLGARVFEKHLTLDTTQAGPDHAASLDPSEMFHYVQKLRIAHEAMGDGIKRIMPCEVANRERYEQFIAPRKERA